MRGSVFAYGPPCPRCGRKWQSIKDPVTGDIINILCPACFTMPSRFAIDGRSFKNRKGSVNRKFHDERRELFYHFQGAKRVLEAIRHDWDILGRERFDPKKYADDTRASLTLFECAKEWQLRLEEVKRSDAYTRQVEQTMRLHILPILGTVDIREVTADDIETLQLSLRKVLSHNSVVLCLSHLNTLLRRYMFRKQVMDKMPVFPENWSALEHPEWRVVTVEEQRSLIAWMVWKTDKRIRWNLLLLLKTYVHLGCRPGEVCALKRKNILEDGRVQIQKAIHAETGDIGSTKTKQKYKIALVPLPASLLAQLRALPVLPEGYLFQSDKGPFNPNALSKVFRKINRFPNVTFYTFSKHTLATITAEEAEREGNRRAAERVNVTVKVLKDHYRIRR